jgi:hypothetical protein
MRASHLASTSALTALLSCATAGTPVPMSPAAPEQGGEFRPTGRIAFSGSGGTGTSAAFDGQRIVGPRINMTRDPSGAWLGNVDGRNTDLSSAPGKLMGAAVELFVDRQGDVINFQGLFFQRQIWIQIYPNRIVGSSDQGRCSFDLSLKSPGVLQGGVGCGTSVSDAVLQLSGEAANLTSPTVPQFVLALLAVLPI